MTHRVKLSERLQLLFSFLAGLQLGAGSPDACWKNQCRAQGLRRRKTRYWRRELGSLIPGSLLIANPDRSDTRRLNRQTRSANNQVPLVEEFDLTDRPAVARIAKLYEVIVNRKADSEGLRVYVAELKRGTPLVDIVRTFLTSDEYGRHYEASAELNAPGYVGACRARMDGLPHPELDRVSSEIAEMIEQSKEIKNAPVLASLAAGFKGHIDQSAAYRWWIDDFERPLLQDSQALEVRARRLQMRPVFTFIMSLHEADTSIISEAVSAIQNQVYPGVELILIADRELGSSIHAIVDPFVSQDPRIRLLSLERRHMFPYSRHQAGIEALLSALQASRGDFLAIITSDSLVSPVAALEFAELLNETPGCEVIYADSDFVDNRRRRHSPEFRSAWDPDRLFAGYGLGPLVMCSTASVRRLRGRWTPVSLQSANFDLCLRVALEIGPSRIKHIPRVLCHEVDCTRRSRNRSCSREGSTKEKLTIVQSVVAKMGARAISEKIGPDSTQCRVVFPILQPPPLVSILVPTRDRVDLLRPCIESLLGKTRYPSFQIVIIDNNSRDDGTFRYYSDLADDSRFKIVSYPEEFNWGAMNNLGVSISDGKILVLLNNDVEVIDQGWLDELVRQVLRPDVGVVGARLLYPDGSLQHGGMITTPRGAGLHAMRFASPSYPGYMNQLRTVREVSAVTGACLAIRKEVYVRIGGIEENELRIACSDVDLCLRVKLSGCRILWTPYSTLIHRELSTRGSDNTPEKVELALREEFYMARKWISHFKEDPHWSPNIALEEEAPPLLAIPPRWTISE